MIYSDWKQSMESEDRNPATMIDSAVNYLYENEIPHLLKIMTKVREVCGDKIESVTLIYSILETMMSDHGHGLDERWQSDQISEVARSCQETYDRIRYKPSDAACCYRLAHVIDALRLKRNFDAGTPVLLKITCLYIMQNNINNAFSLTENDLSKINKLIDDYYVENSYDRVALYLSTDAAFFDTLWESVDDDDSTHDYIDKLTKEAMTSILRAVLVEYHKDGNDYTMYHDNDEAMSDMCEYFLDLAHGG